jgi:hypothetical protein
LGGLEDGLDLLRVGHVHGVGVDVGAGLLADFGGGLLKLGGVAGSDHDGCAFLGEGESAGLSQALAGG